MKKLLLALLTIALPFIAGAQCTTSNATSCQCKDGTTNCDLLPDIIVGKPPLLVSGNFGYIEYPQVCPTGCSGNDGRLRISVSTPNIGFGPLEVRAINTIICGTDTFVNPASGFVCPNGEPLKQLINQRVYHKNGSTMTYTDRPAGSMTYHPTHGHMHVDEWGDYSLRTATADPNPLNWPIVGTGAKLAFCLMDYGSCSTYNGHCVDSAGNTLTSGNFPNYGLGGGAFNCSPSVQGISSGYTDIYYQSLDGMWINLPPNLCNGTYWIVIQLDPKNYFLESNENNNVIAVPITLTQQAGVAPTVSANGPTTICQGSSVTLTASPAVSYLWSNGARTQSITVSQSGNYSVTVNDITSCASASAATAVTVTPMSISASASDTTVCPGAPVQLTAAATGRGSVLQTATFSNNTQVAIPDNSTVGASSVIAVSGINPATLNAASVVSVTVNISHPYDSDLILQLIAPSGNTINLSFRRGGSRANYTNTVFTGSVSQTIMQGVAPFTGSYRPEGSLGSLTGNVNGNWTLKVKDIFSGSTGRIDNWSIAFNNQISTSLNYSWTAPGGYTASGSAAAANPTAGTTYTVNVTETPGGCSGSATVRVNTGTTLNVTTNTPAAICAGASTVLTATGATSYTWSPATGLSATSGASVTASPAQTTTYMVVGTDGFCSDTAYVDVVVNPLPVLQVTNSSPICAGDSATLTVSGATSYQWSPSAGLSSVTGSSVKAGPASTTTYQVTGSLNGCLASTSTDVVVNPIPVVSAGIDVNICAGASTTLTATGATTYSWSPAGTLSSSTGSSVTASPTATTSYTVTGTANNCSASASVTVTVNTKAATPGIISGSPEYCLPATGKVFSIAAVANASSYTWSVPAGAAIVSGQGSTSITVDFTTALSGSICVTADNNCGSSSPACLSIDVRSSAPLQPGSITGTGKACAGSSITYSVAPVPNTTQYVWTLPVGATITSGVGTSTIIVLFNSSFTGGNMSVQAANACGLSAKRFKTISWNVPATPSVITGEAFSLCNVTKTYSVTKVIGFNYTWTAPAGATILSGQGTHQVNIQFGANFTTGTISVVASNNCGTSPARSLSVKAVPQQPAVITGAATVCVNQTNVSYSIPAVTGATSYTWTVPSGSTLVSGQGTNSITVNFGSVAKTASISVKANNACGVSGGRYLSVTINSCIKIESAATNSVDLQVRPNPASSFAEVLFVSANDAKATLRLNNILGQSMYVQSISPTEGENTYLLDVRKFPAGVYLISVEQDGRTSTQRLVIE